MRILFHLPTRSRPDKARLCIQNIIDYCESDNYLILVSADINDDKMNGFEFKHPKVIIHWGQSNNKIHACNRSIHIAQWDILVNTSDDMRFEAKGFDNTIRKAFTDVERKEIIGGPPAWEEITVTNLDRMVFFNDGNQKENACTLSIMGRPYYERFNYVYHPDYENLWADAEFTEVARILGKYKYMGDQLIIFRHLHPAWGLGNWDEQYRNQDNQTTNAKDLDTYTKRKAINFGI